MQLEGWRPSGAGTAYGAHQVWLAGRCPVASRGELEGEEGTRVRGGSSILAVLPEAIPKAVVA